MSLKTIRVISFEVSSGVDRWERRAERTSFESRVDTRPRLLSLEIRSISYRDRSRSARGVDNYVLSV
jgi:hypothetical protein